MRLHDARPDVAVQARYPAAQPVPQVPLQVGAELAIEEPGHTMQLEPQAEGSALLAQLVPQEW
jgi:hypothetical protein